MRIRAFPDGTSIQQYSCRGNIVDVENWTFLSQGSSGYFVKNQVTGECLDVRDGATTSGATVQQWTCTNSTSMLWYPVAGDFPYTFKLKNRRSGLCLDVRAGSQDNFAQIQQYRCTVDNPAQNFYQAPR